MCRRNWNGIIDKCLEKDRDLRYQHASDIRTDLQRLKRDTDSGRVTSSAEPAVTTVARWKLIVPAAAALLALSVAGYFYVHRTPTTHRQGHDCPRGFREQDR